MLRPGCFHHTLPPVLISFHPWPQQKKRDAAPTDSTFSTETFPGLPSPCHFGSPTSPQHKQQHTHTASFHFPSPSLSPFPADQQPSRTGPDSPATQHGFPPTGFPLIAPPSLLQPPSSSGSFSSSPQTHDLLLQANSAVHTTAVAGAHPSSTPRRQHMEKRRR